MPRTSAVAAQNKFIRGLVTESTVLAFPEDACTEVFDCVIDETGRVTRRLGFDYEVGYSTATAVTEGTNEAFTEFLWETVGGNGGLTFFVQQQYQNIHFYDVSTSTAVSANKKSFTVDLGSYIPTGGTADPGAYPCSYTVVNGVLIIANRASDTISVLYSEVSDDITVTAITIEIRDLTGLEDGLGDSQRPTASVASLKVDNPNHYYNLLNQGWWSGTALSEWDTDRTDLPSNADQLLMYRASQTDAFQNNIFLAKTTPAGLAPKGHFIGTATAFDRTGEAAAEGFTGFIVDASSVSIPQADGTIIGTYTNASVAFDGNLSHLAAACATSGPATNHYIGKTLLSPKRIAKAVITNSTDQGWVNGANPAVSVYLYGKNGTGPSSATDGTLIGSTSLGTDSGYTTYTQLSTDVVNTWDHVWVRVELGGALTSVIGEVVFFEIDSNTDLVSTTERATAVATFTSRIFYAGINAIGLNGNIFFSQIIERSNQYGRCYQKNDPTSEDFVDLLPDDGGVIRIPEIGQVVRLFAYQNSLLAFATNGVWLISGSGGQGFLANDYTVKKLSGVGTQSPLSVASVRGVPIWWGDNGIYTIQFDANYNSYVVQSITDTTIFSFVQAVPGLNKTFIKGAYDVDNQLVYWLYNSDPTLAVADYYKYDRVLVMNALSGSFYPWTIGDGTPEVRGVAYIQSSARVVPSVIKYTTTVDLGATETLVFSETNASDYEDWDIGGTAVDYSSYFITGYKIDGEAQKFFQSNYVFIYLEPETGSSCYMQGVWDWTTDSSEGKWSTLQECYNSALTNRGINFRRLKVRGKGRALQLRFESSTGAPFNIIGWSIWETGNAGL